MYKACIKLLNAFIYCKYVKVSHKIKLFSQCEYLIVTLVSFNWIRKKLVC